MYTVLTLAFGSVLCRTTLNLNWSVFIPQNKPQNITDLKLTSQIGNDIQKFAAQEENRAQ